MTFVPTTPGHQHLYKGKCILPDPVAAHRQDDEYKAIWESGAKWFRADILPNWSRQFQRAYQGSLFVDQISDWLHPVVDDHLRPWISGRFVHAPCYSLPSAAPWAVAGTGGAYGVPAEYLSTVWSVYVENKEDFVFLKMLGDALWPDIPDMPELPDPYELLRQEQMIRAAFHAGAV